MENPEKDINSEFVNLDTSEDPADHEAADDSAAFQIANHVVNVTDAGFAIVGAPVLYYTDEGQPYPATIGISINADVGLTKATLAPILRLLADNLEADTNKIQEFLREATGNE